MKTKTTKENPLEKPIKKFIAELEDMKRSCDLRANDVLRPDVLRVKDDATAQAYAYCQMKMRMILEID